MMNSFIEWLLSDFGLAMFVLSLFFISVHLMMRLKTITFYEIVFRWIAFFPLGITGIYTGLTHALFPDISASLIGWEPSPFQFEVAMGDLAMGVLGIGCFHASYSFRLAAIVAVTIQYWGDAIGHIYNMAVMQNFAPGNAGSWFWLDLIVPAILLLCLSRQKATS